MTPLEKYMELKKEFQSGRAAVPADQIRVVVHMGICSQSVGAHEVIKALQSAVNEQDIKNVVIDKTGCAGFCAYEPLVILQKKGRKSVTYCKVTPEMAKVLLPEYAIKNRVIEPWTLNGKEVLL